MLQQIKTVNVEGKRVKMQVASIFVERKKNIFSDDPYIL